MDNTTPEPVSIRALIADASIANPGDVVILNYPHPLSNEQIKSIHGALDPIGDERGIKFLVVGGGVQVTVARKSEGSEA